MLPPCSRCGSSLSDGGRFCVHCGTQAAPAVPPAPPVRATAPEPTTPAPPAAPSGEDADAAWARHRADTYRRAQEAARSRASVGRFVLVASLVLAVVVPAFGFSWLDDQMRYGGDMIQAVLSVVTMYLGLMMIAFIAMFFMRLAVAGIALSATAAQTLATLDAAIAVDPALPEEHRRRLLRADETGRTPARDRDLQPNGGLPTWPRSNLSRPI